MKKRRLIYQLFPSYLMITLVSLLAVSWYALSFTRQFYLERTQANLEINGRLLEKQVARMLTPLDAPAVDRFCKDAAGQTVTRVTVILPDGRVVGDSEEMPAKMDSHLDREEIREAFLGKVGVRIRHSDTLKQDMMYVALPLYVDSHLAGVLRTSIPVTAIDERLGTIQWRISLGALLIALLASVGSWYASRTITRPLEKMRDGARQFAAGVLTHRLPLYDIYEFSALAETMNQMAEQLQQRLEEITRQHNKTDAVLSSMREGVIAMDMAQRVISINQAAAGMFGVSVKHIHGQSILEIIRNHEFQSLISDSLSTGESVEADISFHLNEECIFNVHCTPLLENMQRIGGLLVISDVTQLRRLENMRRDFAASVSHEIKTPLTAIKGFVETLCTGDLRDREETRRFLKIIDKHVNRLATIIDDLMRLSRIERDDKTRRIGLEEYCRIADVVNTAVNLCADGISEKQIDVQLSCEPELNGCFDASLLEQAAVNLLDNAIKYSPEKSVIHIQTLTADDEIQIHFKDQGLGISRKHLPRLFERFYRVDKARSRHLGGTGLGLAIVKHIAQAHGGSVSVESEPAKGSTFTLHLPIQRTRQVTE